MLNKPEVTLTIRLPERLSNRLNRAARDLDQTRGELIRQALDHYLTEPDGQPSNADQSRSDTHVIQ